MKPISIKFTDSEGKTTRTVSACSVKTGVMDRIFDIAERAEEFEQGKLGIAEARVFFNELKAIMVDVFGRQFSFDELDQGVDFDELLRVFTAMCAGLTGGIGKNR